jgi:hypothetical protein
MSITTEEEFNTQYSEILQKRTEARNTINENEQS